VQSNRAFASSGGNGDLYVNIHWELFMIGIGVSFDLLYPSHLSCVGKLGWLLGFVTE